MPLSLVTYHTQLIALRVRREVRRDCSVVARPQLLGKVTRYTSDYKAISGPDLGAIRMVPIIVLVAQIRPDKTLSSQEIRPDACLLHPQKGLRVLMPFCTGPG